MLARRHIPNLLTMLRLALAAVFFVLLSSYQYGTGEAFSLIPAIVIFVVAALTDMLDGMLARRWQVESKFGRIMDPFCDKVLVIGAFCFLAGPGFESAVPVVQGEQTLVHRQQISGVYPWMVVVILARELLVTGVRGEMESSGHKFGANIWGKLKMVLQAVAIPGVLALVITIELIATQTIGSIASGMAIIQFAMLRDILVYATVIVTVLSGLPYATGALRVIKAEREA